MAASYAKQADDDSLRRLADRIQARAVRRAGELLKTFDGRGGDKSKTTGAHGFAPEEQSLSQRAISRRSPEHLSAAQPAARPRPRARYFFGHRRPHGVKGRPRAMRSSASEVSRSS